MKSNVRRLCSTCRKKRYLRNMYVVYYPLIYKVAIHCSSCYDEANMFFLKMSPQGDK